MANRRPQVQAVAAPRGRTPRWLRRSAALLLGFVAVLTVLELGMRLADFFPLHRNPMRGFHRDHPTLGWRGVPDYSASFVRPDFNVLIQHDEEGFRLAQAESGPPAPEARRVAVLGDSFTWGWGVGQGQVFTDVLATRLGPGTWIRNFGVCAYGTGQQSILLREVVAGWDPELVILMVFPNDFKDNSDDREGRRPWFTVDQGRLVAKNHPVRRSISSPLRDLTRHSVAASFIQYNTNLLLNRLREGEVSASSAGLAVASAGETEVAREVASVDAGVALLDPKWNAIFQALIDDMLATCEGMPSSPELRIVYIPRWSEIPRTQASTLERAVRETCEARAIPYLNLVAGLRARWASHPESTPRVEPFYFPLDDHWSALGHAVAAELILASNTLAPSGTD